MQGSMLTALCSQQEGIDVASLKSVPVEENSFLEAVKIHLLEKDNKTLYSEEKSADAFKCFVNNGGNVGLYDRCVQKALPFFKKPKHLSILDLGCGGGKLLLPVLEALKDTRGDMISLCLVDLNMAMMEGLKEKVLQILPHADVTLKEASFAAFAEECEEEFDLCLSSFAMHYSVGEERAKVLNWIRCNCKRFLLFEFDVDSEMLGRSITDRERFDFLVKRFENGVEEYAGLDVADRELVRKFFLAPVFCLNFLGASESQEQSAKKWEEEMLAAGFESVNTHFVSEYWWSNCILVEGCKRLN